MADQPRIVFREAGRGQAITQPSTGIAIFLRGATVRNLRLGTNVTIFLLFFALSLLDAFQTHDWVRAAFWCAIGLVFLFADALKRPSK